MLIESIFLRFMLKSQLSMINAHKISELDIFPEIEHQTFAHERIEKLIQKTG